jgi:hypothetical protein
MLWQVVTILPLHSDVSGEISVEASLLVKHIKPGAHVKVNPSDLHM